MTDYPSPDWTRAEIEAWKEAKRAERLMPIAREVSAAILGTPADRLVAEMAVEARVEAVLKKSRRCSECNRTGHVKGHCPPCSDCGQAGHWSGSRKCPKRAKVRP